MQSVLERLRDVDWAAVRQDSRLIFSKLLRTRTPLENETNDNAPPGRNRLSRCLSTMDLTSLGVGSCVGTGMYLVAGLVTRKFAGPGVILSFMIAALASLFSGTCYAEFGVRVPNTTGSAYTYSYVTVGEFAAFIIGWNMVLEYMIGTSACARAISASLNSISNGTIENKTVSAVGNVYGKPPDFLAFSITTMMMMVLAAGVKKSMVFTNVLNSINFMVWVFIMSAGMFYVNTDNWTDKGFLPNGWSGVFSGAATCFYAFIGFDIIATTGEEAKNPKRSIPLAIVLSLIIILTAYVSTSIMLTLIVPYDKVDANSALVQMFAYVNAPICKYIVAIGALAGLIVSMFGSMFPMPRVLYAMANDGLIFKGLAAISERTGTPAFATFCGGMCAALMSLVIQLEVLVEMMSIGTLLAYTLVSTCVLVLRYQPGSPNLIELLPQSLRAPAELEAAASRETSFNSHQNRTQMLGTSQRVMVRRVTRSSPDSDDTFPEDESEDGRDNTYLMNSHIDNEFYGAVPAGAGSTSNSSRCARFFSALYRQLHVLSYLCPGLFPWVDYGPATHDSGLFVIKTVGVMLVMIILFNIVAVHGTSGTFCTVVMVFLFIGIIVSLLMISRKPQNRANLAYITPALPFVPATAALVNIYLMMNLSYLSIIRFGVWMTVGLIIYFKYGIKNSTLERQRPAHVPTPPTPSPLSRTTIPPPSPHSSKPTGDRNIFEGDGENGFFGGHDQYTERLLTWHEAELRPGQSASGGNVPSGTFKQIETRYDEKTNSTSSHTSTRPPWAYPDSDDTWDD